MSRKLVSAPALAISSKLMAKKQQYLWNFDLFHIFYRCGHINSIVLNSKRETWGFYKQAILPPNRHETPNLEKGKN